MTDGTYPVQGKKIKTAFDIYIGQFLICFDSACRRIHVWHQLVFSLPGAAFCCGSFVDNIFSTGRDPESAVAILQDLEVDLKQHWRLELGPDSKQVVCACGYGSDLQDANVNGWAVLETMRCLGHHLSSSCSISKDWHETVKKVWGAYFCNAHAGLKRASLRAHMRFINSSLKSVIACRWSRWPWQKSYAGRVDRLQRHLIGCIRPVRPLAGEEPELYYRRRSRVCGQHAQNFGRWSSAWARSVLRWEDHVTRANDPGAWGKHIRDWHDLAWLQRRRFENGHSGSWSRTGTRAYRGHPAMRWSQGVIEASNYLRL